ncbi:MAG: nucleoside hydrolase [Anaerococcus sp.]|uniref:nucleoside hydrolase n=1 Tax=Anaerococcus sp. TaxID=1872515 RepID=UPI00290B2068|nr:nucleoside hydrolase [Anaerococcus sp.]MDU4025522.1 nucleoside hydrolase [Anaerococcus sp.]
MKKIIIDTDCTIDVKGCDLDDAFAILFLIAHPDIEVKLITTTFGNNNEDVSYKATRRMLDDLNINIPLIKGGLYTNDAGEAIRNELEKNDDIIILSLGSTTNTQKALALGMDAKKVKSFVAMGGITDKLRFNKKIMSELNLSIDYLSTIYCLSRLDNIHIITGNNCMKHKYQLPANPDYKSNFMNYLKPSLKRATEEFMDEFGENELVVWDALAALYITNPEFFSHRYKNISLDEHLLNGYLMDGDDKKVNLPEIKENINAMEYIVNVIEKNN